MRSDQAVRRLLAGALALVGLFLVSPPSAQADGTYDVSECTASHPSAPDALHYDFSASRYAFFNDCADPGGALHIISEYDSTPSGGFSSWQFGDVQAARIESASIDYTLSPAVDGHEPIVFTSQDASTPEIQVSAGAAEKTGTFTADGGDFETIGAGVICGDPGACPASYFTGSAIDAARFTMRDTSPPETPSFYYFTPAGGIDSWANSTAFYGVTQQDYGMGVGRSTLTVNGTELENRRACEEADAAGAYSSMNPCPTDAFHGYDADVTAAPFVEGLNDVEVCTYELSAGGSSACKSGTAKVDTIAPAPVSGLDVAQGTDWQTSDQFDLSWTSPTEGPTPAKSPVSTAVVHLSGPNGYDDTQYFQNNDGVEDLQVPFEGEYRADVYLMDEAGNGELAQAATTRLRFDGTAPPASDVADPLEWVSRDELAAGVTARWSKPEADEVPVSGLDGYAVDVDQDPATDPCAGGAELYLCGGDVDQPGIDSNTRTLHTGDVVEGTNYVHVVPVSGAGIRADDVGTGEIPVDLTDPVASITGDPGTAWTNTTVALTATATDSLSGMDADGDYPRDDLARTVIEVDGQRAQDAGADVTATIGDEGTHQVSYFARDVAGNSSAPQSLTVRIDKTGPQLTFPDEQSGSKIVASIADPLSGPAAGELSYRQLGTSEWRPLPTSFTGSTLEAEASGIVVDPGATYQLRATGRDLASNVSAERAPGPSTAGSGSAAPPAVSSLRIELDRKTAGYDDRAVLSGRLRSEVSVAGAEVRVTQAFGKGSKPRTLRRPVTVAADGRFSVKLQRGPSRGVSVTFAGDTAHLPSRSPELALGVRSRLSIAAPRLLRSGGPLELRGRISSRNVRLTPAGKLVAVEVRSAGERWSPLERIRSSRHGSWRVAIEDLDPGRYQVRARVPRQRGFPYLPSKSKPRPIVVGEE